MVLYECFRCGYNTKLKGNLKHHLNRKNICEAIDDDVEIDEIKKYYDFNIIKNIPQNTTFLPQNTTILPQNTTNTLPQNTTILPQNTTKMAEKYHKIPQNTTKIFQCKYCNKILSRYDSLNRHIKTCKGKKETETLVISQNEEINKMKSEINELKNLKIQTQNNITNTNSNNITNNNTININNYGDENLKHLRSKDFANLLNGIYGAVPRLIKQIHFDPKHPENQNIKYTNKKLPYLKVMKNDKWQLVNKKHELLDLIDNKCYMLKEKYYTILEKNKYNITNTHRDKIEEFMNKYNEEDKKMMLDLIERTELMLLNNS